MNQYTSFIKQLVFSFVVISRIIPVFPLKILPGIEIIRSDIYNKYEYEQLNNKSDMIENNTLIGKVVNYLKDHELKVQLSQLLNSSDVRNMYQQAKMVYSDETQNAGKSYMIAQKKFKKLVRFQKNLKLLT